MVESKPCRKCGDVLPLGEFPPSKVNKDGRFSYCYPCKRRSYREHYQRHRCRRIAGVQAYQAQRPDQVADIKRAWARANPEKRRLAKRRWQQANNATFVRASNARRRAVKANAPTVPFHSSLLLARWDYYAGRCWICGGEATAMDHVKPLSKGGWHIPANLRPVCTPCNTRKRNTWPLAA